jgi:hypothetical protein
LQDFQGRVSQSGELAEGYESSLGSSAPTERILRAARTLLRLFLRVLTLCSRGSQAEASCMTTPLVGSDQRIGVGLLDLF